MQLKNILLTNKQIISHLRDRPYMSGIDRDKWRIKATGEVFTPTELVQEMISKIDESFFKEPNKTFLDPSVGDGQFLSEVIIKKIENGISFKQALSTCFGLDIKQDNIDLTKERLLCGQKHLQHIVDKNIVCADALRYHGRFDGTDPYKTGQDIHNESLFEIT